VLKKKEIRNTEEGATPRAGTAPARKAPSQLERMLRFGPKVLADEELVALVLGPGGPVSASDMSRLLLRACGDLHALVELSPLVLCRQHGMGLSRATRLTAAVELGLRCRLSVRRAGLKVSGPRDLRSLLTDEFRGLDREHFLAIYLDARHRVIAVDTVSIGSLNASLVHPREVFKPAVSLSAAAIIAAHNHPSGNAQPSGDDLELTCRLARCGWLLGVELLDHIVFGDGRLVSIREYGWPDEAPDRTANTRGLTETLAVKENERCSNACRACSRTTSPSTWVPPTRSSISKARGSS